MTDLFESFEKGSMYLLVSLGEFRGYFVQEWPDLVFCERHNPGDNPARSLGIFVPERAEKNAGLIRSEDRGRAADANRGGGDHGLGYSRETRPETTIGSIGNSVLPSCSSCSSCSLHSLVVLPVSSLSSLLYGNHRRGTASATTQSLQRRSWARLIKNALGVTVHC
jgi:hypothetical protein